MLFYLICYLVSFLLAGWRFYIPSGIILMAAAVWLYIYDYRRSKNLIHLRALFSLFWVGGQGVACLKLSELQSDWSLITWFCFLAALAGFWVVFEFMSRWFGISYENGRGRRRSFSANPKPVFTCMMGLTGVSLGAFIFEAIYLGFIPLFIKGVPHAYSEFHVTAIHYFTVSSVLIPALSVLYFYTAQGRGSDSKAAAAIIMDVIAFAIPILCVSRYQFIFAVVLAVFTYAAVSPRLHPAWLAGMGAAILPVYILLTVARSHDAAYLNGIFEMKNANMPIFISQPYIYIANNYENFNCMVNYLPKFSLGIRGLFPLWALTGLKFLVPSLIYYPIYVTKEELTTLTMFYDSYYDFGIPGVLLFSCVLGVVAYLLVVKLREMHNPFGFLLYAQIAIYFMLSFFTTWFSNPTTWFYLFLTGIMAVFYGMREHRR